MVVGGGRCLGRLPLQLVGWKCLRVVSCVRLRNWLDIAAALLGFVGPNVWVCLPVPAELLPPRHTAGWPCLVVLLWGAAAAVGVPAVVLGEVAVVAVVVVVVVLAVIVSAGLESRGPSVAVVVMVVAVVVLVVPVLAGV